MSETNFDQIRKVALMTASAPKCPEVSKDFLLKMVADETSCMDILRAIAIMCVGSESFGSVLHMSIEKASVDYLAYRLGKLARGEEE
jgi:hypothetical protein